MALVGVRVVFSCFMVVAVVDSILVGGDFLDIVLGFPAVNKSPAFDEDSFSV